MRLKFRNKLGCTGKCRAAGWEKRFNTPLIQYGSVFIQYGLTRNWLILYIVISVQSYSSWKAVYNKKTKWEYVKKNKLEQNWQQSLPQWTRFVRNINSCKENCRLLLLFVGSVFISIIFFTMLYSIPTFSLNTMTYSLHAKKKNQSQRLLFAASLMSLSYLAKEPDFFQNVLWLWWFSELWFSSRTLLRV